MKIAILVAIGLAAASVAAAQTRKDAVARQSQAKAKVQSSQAFAALADRFVKESLALSPVSASYAGYHKHPGQEAGETIELDALLDDVSPAAFAEQRRFYSGWRERFPKEAPVEVAGRAGRRGLPAHRRPDRAEPPGAGQDRELQAQPHGLRGADRQRALPAPVPGVRAEGDARRATCSRASSRSRASWSRRSRCWWTRTPSSSRWRRRRTTATSSWSRRRWPRRSPRARRCGRGTTWSRPRAVAALKDFNRWMQDDLGKRPTTRTWRLGKEWYDPKFKLVMEAPITPEQILADAEREMAEVRAEMLRLALPLHKQMYPDHTDHAECDRHRAREPRHRRGPAPHLRRPPEARRADGRGEEGPGRRSPPSSATRRSCPLSARQNLKVIPTPPFMRGIYSVAGFAAPPPLEPTAEAQYWVTPIDPSVPDERAESKLREYNDWVLKWLTIHEALPGHYVQFEHANDVQPPTPARAAQRSSATAPTSRAGPSTSPRS